MARGRFSLCAPPSDLRPKESQAGNHEFCWSMPCFAAALNDFDLGGERRPPARFNRTL
jgi:hypothetical protein